MNINEFIRIKSRGRYHQIVEMSQEEGGFGRLYRAKDMKRPSTDICIKVIKANLTKDLQLKLWKDEVTAMGRYKSRSGIVHLVDEQYEFTEDDPYIFLVMDYVHGKRLGSNKYQIELNVSEDEAILLIFQLCSVMFSIHQRGDYHQDIFPDNIKIQGTDLFLLDLGGMREAERRSGTIIFGGEMYSPPEVSPTRLRMKRFRTLRKQKMGSFESADIFSIGAILYELLMGVPFFDNIEQSNSLKEYIYDYYTDAENLKLNKDYKAAIDAVTRNQKNFQEFLEQYRMPADLCQCLAATLALYPPQRPTIETLLRRLAPYLFHRATEYGHISAWEQAYLWVKYLERHVDEIYREQEESDALIAQKMQRHLHELFPLYLRSCLLGGQALFHQGQTDSAYQIFCKTQEMLDLFHAAYAGRQRNTILLKLLNNLAACHYKLKRQEEAVHLLKTLSTAPGNLGRIINQNLQVCAA